MTGRPQSPPVRRECRHARKHEHGTTAAYRADWCRCVECRAACAAAFIRSGRCSYVNRATHLTIVALYDRLWDQQPPTATKHQKGSVSRAKRHARINGWKPPMYWDDDLIDEPTCVHTSADARSA